MYGCLKISKSKILCVLLVIAAAVLLACLPKGHKKGGTVKNDRLEFISSLGYEVDGKSCSSKTFTVPSVFSDVYKNYNELQKSAGYDLLDYAGKQVTLYTYKLKDNENMRIDLIIYNDKVIGGDISSAELGGSIKPLVPQSKEK